jgi:hypothetical protein
MVEFKSNEDAAATQAPRGRNLNFTAGGPIYALSEDATEKEIQNQLSARLTHLSAMLMTIHGCGIQTFESWSERVKDDYLWGCSTLAEECKELASLL